MNGPIPDSGETETLEGFSDWQPIGKGGDATVYRAIQDDLRREVAIKVLTVDDAESVRRFTREVQLMVSLGRQHPNIAKVLQIGTSTRGRPCIVMDYYELGSLDQRMAAYGRLSADEAVQVGTVVADALAFAHSKGVLHRDVKPQNILILPTSYVLSDFGIARLIDSAHTASTDRFSYRHASPQVLEGAPPSEADDIFSLGATLFHILDGKPPFTLPGDEPDSALAYIKRVQTQPPRRLRRKDLPPELVAIIERALDKDPRQRFQTAAELRDALASVRSEARAWSQTPPPAALPTLPTDPRAFDGATGPTGWGGVPGRTIDPRDLTAMRLAGMTGGTPSATGPWSAPSASLPSATGPGSMIEEEPRAMPLTAILLAGVTLGIAAVLVWFLLIRPRTSADPAPVPTPAASNSAVRIDHNLTPRNVRVTDRGNTAVISWDLPIATPDTYLITRATGPTAPSSVVGDPIAHPTHVTVVPVPQGGGQICFSVVGVKGGKLAPSQSACIRG